MEVRVLHSFLTVLSSFPGTTARFAAPSHSSRASTAAPPPATHRQGKEQQRHKLNTWPLNHCHWSRIEGQTGRAGGGWQHVRRLFLVQEKTYGTQQHIAAPSHLLGRHSFSFQICWELWPSSEPILCVFWLARGVMDRWWWCSEWANISVFPLDCNAILRKCMYAEGTGNVCSAMHAYIHCRTVFSDNSLIPYIVVNNS